MVVGVEFQHGIDFVRNEKKRIRGEVKRHPSASSAKTGFRLQSECDAWRRRFAKVGRRNLQFSAASAGMNIDRIDSGAADNGESSNRFFFALS